MFALGGRVVARPALCWYTEAMLPRVFVGRMPIQRSRMLPVFTVVALAISISACSAPGLEREASQRESQAEILIEALNDAISERDATIADMERAAASGDFTGAETARAAAANLQADIDASTGRIETIQAEAASLRDRAEAEDSAFAGFAELASLVGGAFIPGAGIAGAIALRFRRSWRTKDAAPLVEIVDLIRDQFPEVDTALNGELGTKARLILTEGSPKLQQAVINLKRSRGS